MANQRNRNRRVSSTEPKDTPSDQAVDLNDVQDDVSLDTDHSETPLDTPVDESVTVDAVEPPVNGVVVTTSSGGVTYRDVVDVPAETLLGTSEEKVSEPSPTESDSKESPLTILGTLEPLTEPEPEVEEPKEVITVSQLRQPNYSESATVMSLKHQIDEYITAMSPTVSQTVGSLCTQQVNLHNLFVRTVSERNADDFMTLVLYWLEQFKKHRAGVFNNRFAYRCLDSALLQLGKSQRTFLESMILIFQTLAAENVKSASRSVSLDTLCASIASAEGRQRMQKFITLALQKSIQA